MLRALLVAAVLTLTVAFPLPAEAQTARPGVDCSLLTASQAQGLPCANQPKPDPPVAITAPPLEPGPTWADPDCQDLNPYRDPEKAKECSNRPGPTDAEPTILVGGRYGYGYIGVPIEVIALARDPVDNVLIVTFRFESTGLLSAERKPPTPGGLTNWIYLGQAR